MKHADITRNKVGDNQEKLQPVANNCSHLLPLFEAKTGFEEVVGGPRINPKNGKVVTKNHKRFLRFVSKMNVKC